jgi:hypothetical protein
MQTDAFGTGPFATNEASMEHDSEYFLLVNDNKAYLAFRSHQVEEFHIHVWARVAPVPLTVTKPLSEAVRTRNVRSWFKFT